MDYINLLFLYSGATLVLFFIIFKEKKIGSISYLILIILPLLTIYHALDLPEYMNEGEKKVDRILTVIKKTSIISRMKIYTISDDDYYAGNSFDRTKVKDDCLYEFSYLPLTNSLIELRTAGGGVGCTENELIYDDDAERWITYLLMVGFGIVSCVLFFLYRISNRTFLERTDTN